MLCVRDRNRTLLLSLGLFGAPASQLERDRAAQAAERTKRLVSPAYLGN